MATRPEFPSDVAAAFERYPEARDRFAELPPERQAEWLNWIERGGRRGRPARVDELIRRLLPTEEEVVEPTPPPRERYWWVWLLLLLLLVVGGLLAWWLLTRGDDKATVPNVIGLREPAAVQRIQDESLDSRSVVGDSKRPPGVVFAQSPGAGTQLSNGQTVVLSVSSGRIIVPDVTSLPVQQAVQKLTDAGLKAEVKGVASSKPKDTIIAQSPAAGVTAETGTTVTLTASSGAKPVVVPKVVGQTQGQAVDALTSVGLKPALHNVPSSQPAGSVVAQNPPAGTEVDKGSKVTLNVSTGTGPATTTTSPTTTAGGSIKAPKVTGLAATPALRQLNAQGLFATVVYQSSSQPAGRVLSQSPAAGTSVKRGSHVRVVVSTGPNPQPATTVPDVTGQDQATAVDTLQSAGFRVLVLNHPTTNQSQDGVVTEQQPHAGASIPGDSLVALYVGRLNG